MRMMRLAPQSTMMCSRPEAWQRAYDGPSLVANACGILSSAPGKCAAPCRPRLPDCTHTSPETHLSSLQRPPSLHRLRKAPHDSSSSSSKTKHGSHRVASSKSPVASWLVQPDVGSLKAQCFLPDAISNQNVAPGRLVHAIAVALGSLLRTSLPPNVPSDVYSSTMSFQENILTSTTAVHNDDNTIIWSVQTHLHELLLHLTSTLALHSACLLIALVLVERSVRAGVPFRVNTCRRLVLAALVLSTKIHFDESVKISDFNCVLAHSAKWHPLCKQLATCEVALFHSVLRYNVIVTSETYEEYVDHIQRLMYM